MGVYTTIQIFTMLPRLAPNWRSSCLSLPSAGTAGMGLAKCMLLKKQHIFLTIFQLAITAKILYVFPAVLRCACCCPLPITATPYFRLFLGPYPTAAKGQTLWGEGRVMPRPCGDTSLFSRITPPLQRVKLIPSLRTLFPSPHTSLLHL